VAERVEYRAGGGAGEAGASEASKKKKGLLLSVFLGLASHMVAHVRAAVAHDADGLDGEEDGEGLADVAVDVEVPELSGKG
jgi:hypothetical protein